MARALQSTTDTKRFYTLHGAALTGTDGHLYELVHEYLGIRVNFGLDTRCCRAVLLMQPGKVRELCIRACGPRAGPAWQISSSFNLIPPVSLCCEGAAAADL
jgi:hypothetical protein